MTAPGITVTTLNSQPPVVVPGPTGTWFVTGLSERGPLGSPVELHSMADYATFLGVRSGYASLYDALDLFFRDGGTHAYVSRVAGPGAATAELILSDRATTPQSTIRVRANSPGTWGNALKVEVQNGQGSNTYRLLVTYQGVLVETSPDLTSPADAVAWASRSAYVAVVDLASVTAAPNNIPATLAASFLASGADDNGGVVESTWTAALDAFPADLGPGQVSAPGRTTSAAYQALVNHAAARNRIALLDGVDTATADTLVTAAQNAVAGGLDGSRAALLAPWITVPGISTGGPLPALPRTVPPSALVAARIAATDVLTQNPNTAAAGTPNGASGYALGVTQVYTDADRGKLNTAGVDVVRNIASVVQLYGFRTLSNDPQWTQLGWSRLRMAIQNEGQQIAAAIAQFGTIDAKGQLLGRLNGHLAGMLQKYWQIGALYGNTATEAFTVDTSASVNTVQTAAAGQVIAVLSIRRAAMAEFTRISIVNVPLTQSV
jgi:hypothetical protein